uniref:ring protein gp10 n=1 Tax=Vibrio cholerae TaxID=666 RepID=UPI003510D2A3
MSSWDRFDTPWDSIIDESTWEHYTFKYDASFEAFSSMEVDEDLTITVSVLFASTSDNTVTVGQVLGLTMDNRAGSYFGAGSSWTSEAAVNNEAGSGFQSSHALQLSYSVEDGVISSFGSEAFCSFYNTVSFESSSDVQAAVNSLYNLDVLFSSGSGDSEQHYVVFGETASFESLAEHETSSQYITHVECMFNSVVEFEVKTYDWGRPVKPVGSDWSTDTPVVGVWVNEIYNGNKDWGES